MATMNVLDSVGGTVAVEKPLAPGQAAMAASRPVVLASDQSSIPVAATLAAETTKVIGTVRTASGGIASGSVAAGALATGAGVDGWDLTQGAIADAASATGSISAKLRGIATALGITAFDLGSGTGGSRTLRVAMDTSQVAALGQTTMSASQPVAIASDQSAIPVTPAGNVAHDAVDSGNGLKQAAKATTSLAGLTLVASADRTDLFAGVDGVQIVRPHCNLEDIVTAVVTSTTGANTSGIAAQGAGIKFYLCALLAANTGGVAGGTISVTDGSGGTEKASIPYTQLGVVENLPVPIPFSANTAVFVDPSGTDTMKITLIGFKSKV